MASSTAISSAITQEPLPGLEKSAVPPKLDFIVRRCRLSDIPYLAVHTTHTYSPVADWLYPGAKEHPEELLRIFRRGIEKYYVNPAGIFLVACLASSPSIPIGSTFSIRVGTDPLARQVVYEKGYLLRAWLFVLSWYFWAYHWAETKIWKDHVTDVVNQKDFAGRIKHDTEKYWSQPERQNRWKVMAATVDPPYHSKGVGRALLQPIIDRAERERVIVGLSSSSHGEHLYRKLGFELMGDFSMRLPAENDFGGGHMIRYFEGYQGERHEKYDGWYDQQKRKESELRI